MRAIPFIIATGGMLYAASSALQAGPQWLRIAYLMGVMANAFVLGWCVRSLPR